jgi:16S rRNA (adenine1518-N6/adenine1519-N6)-dimethyltransferase
MEFLSKQKIISLCRETGFRPRRQSGQNFLINQKIVDQIINEADLNPEDTVLEIGAGFGFITEALVEKVKKVIAVELDKRLARYLLKKFSNDKKVTIIHDDIFKINLKKYLEDRKYKIIANLPFNITSLILRNFLSQKPRPDKMTLIIQKEVAKRTIAKPGEMSLLSVMVQFYSKPEVVSVLPKHYFWPKPEVDSALMKINLNGEKEKDIDEKKFFQIVKMGFSARRKQLHNNLSTGLKIDSRKTKEILQKLGLQPMIRPQNLSVIDWQNLVKHI